MPKATHYSVSRKRSVRSRTRTGTDSDPTPSGGSPETPDTRHREGASRTRPPARSSGCLSSQLRQVSSPERKRTRTLQPPLPRDAPHRTVPKIQIVCFCQGPHSPKATAPCALPDVPGTTRAASPPSGYAKGNAPLQVNFYTFSPLSPHSPSCPNTLLHSPLKRGGRLDGLGTSPSLSPSSAPLGAILQRRRHPIPLAGRWATRSNQAWGLTRAALAPASLSKPRGTWGFALSEDTGRTVPAASSAPAGQLLPHEAQTLLSRVLLSTVKQTNKKIFFFEGNNTLHICKDTGKGDA